MTESEPIIEKIYFTLEYFADPAKIDEKFWIGFKSYIIEEIDVRVKDYLEEQGVLVCSRPLS